MATSSDSNTAPESDADTPDPGDEWIAAAISDLPGASFSYKPEWESWVMWVAGKMFGMRGSHPDKGELLTLKGDPEDNQALREEFDSVEPGYYSNKVHWNSVLLDQAEVPQERMVALIDEAYALVVAKLPKATREALAESA